MNKYELAVVVSAKIEDDERAQVIEKVKALVERFGGQISDVDEFDELYGSVGVLGMEFSAKVRALEGKRVRIRGFMAPPLKADAVFFVLTAAPVSLCPFCNSEADWPADIVVAYLAEGERFVQNNELIEAVGLLEAGSATDPDTGFVSLLRLRDTRVERL